MPIPVGKFAGLTNKIEKGKVLLSMEETWDKYKAK